MCKILSCIELNEQIQERIKQELKTCMIRPSIAVIKVGDNELIDFSVKKKEQLCSNIGIYFRLFEFENNTPELAIINKIKELNNDEYVHGIMVELPLPNNYNERRILNSISNVKDIDGLTDINAGRLMNGRRALIPSTAQSVFKLLEMYNIPLFDKNIFIIGGLTHINRSLTSLFMAKKANVIWCQDEATNIDDKLSLADIIIIGSDISDMFNIKCLKDESIIIDLGIWKNHQFTSIIDETIIKEYTHVSIPNGINLVALSILLENVMLCYKNIK